jgi:N6-L-threonylcarbamoyladenine synthase
VTHHDILLNTRDTAIGDYLDKVARVLKIPWGDRMPGAALEEWTQINEVDDNILLEDIDRWNLPRPLSSYKKNVLAFSFTGIRTAVESIVEKNQEMSEEEKKSLGRAAQILIFKHVAEKCILGIEASGDGIGEGTLVVSGGVACNTALRKMYPISR